jgi:antitoxin VapB
VSKANKGKVDPARRAAALQAWETMTLNIKHPEAHKLAKALQQETGETMTHAVVQALRERLEKIKQQREPEATAAELLAIGRRCARVRKGPAVDHGTLLYDQNGLPR